MRRSPRLAVVLLAAAIASAARADVVRILEDPADAAQARVDLIQQARREINALYFLARNDRVTMTALALLRDAQRSGVTSRLLVDANFHHIPKAVLAHLRDEGVQVKEYHPITLRHPTWIWRRLHEKLVVVDGERYITGGRNLAEAYFALAAKKNYVDRDVFVEGSSALEADRHFDALWESGHVRELRVRVSGREKRRAAKRLDALIEEMRCGESFVRLDTGTDWAADAHLARDVRFLHDPIESGTPRVGARLHEIFESAQTSIVIESPYLIPGRALRALLERKRAEGVHVQIVTNSIRSTDGLLPFAGYLKYRHRLVRAGIDVREYKGPDTLHAKSAVVDRRIVLVGSYNIDSRSQNLDLEAMCVAEDEELARELLHAIQVHVQHAEKVDPRKWPRMPRTTLLSLRSLQLLLPLFEGQL